MNMNTPIFDQLSAERRAEARPVSVIITDATEHRRTSADWTLPALLLIAVMAVTVALIIAVIGHAS